MSFGAALRQAREELGWTQPQLSDAIRDASEGLIHLSPAEISRYERGRVRNPRLDVVRAVAKATNRPTDFFAAGAGEVADGNHPFRPASTA